jgi:hypothetical protein
MRTFVMLAVAVAVVVIGYGVVTGFFAGSSAPSMSSETAANTLSPHEIHMNYKEMEKLPVHDVKDAF